MTRYLLPQVRALAIATTCVLMAVGCDALSGDKSAESDEDKVTPLPVETRQVARGNVTAVYSGTAALEVEAQAEVAAKVPGVIVDLLVEEGAQVSAGQVLARLDGERLRLEVERQRANVRKLEQDYRRNVELHEKGLVSVGAFEGMKYELESLRAALRIAQLEVNYTEVRAPFDGVIAARHVKRGNNVTVNQSLFTITDFDPLLAYLHVPEKEFSKLTVDQPAAVEADALPGKVYPGRIARISPVIDAGSGTFKVTVEIKDDSGRLKPGMFARISVVYDQRDDVVLVPRAALVDTDSEPAVFVVKDGVATRQLVQTGYANGADIEIVAGLNGDEEIVVIGQNSLKDGGLVRVVGDEPPDSRTVVEDTLNADTRS